MTIQIAYNDSSFNLRLEMPPEWNVDAITSMNIGVKDWDGDDLLAATAATLYTATTLNGAVSVGDSTITLANTATALTPGDRVRIAASASGPAEEVEVVFYNSSTYTATLRHETRHAHATSTAVRGLWATYALDTTTVADWPAAQQCIVSWYPGGSDDRPLRQRAEISVIEFNFADFARRFEMLYPREWKLRENRTGGIKGILEEAKKQVRGDLLSRDFDINRVVDSAIIEPLVLAKARWLVLLGTGDKWTTEREVALDEYHRQMEIVSNSPLWKDDNQDYVRDEVEMDDAMQLLGSERGF